MQSVFTNVGRSVSLKVVFIAALILVMLIPVSMIKGVIHDRTAVSNEAQQDVMRSWGYEQLIAAPIFVLPYSVTIERERGGRLERATRIYKAYVLPRQLEVDVDLRPDTRYRGIHEITVYSANLKISGSFDRPTMARLPDNVESVMWEDAYIALAVSDPRAIVRTPEILFAGKSTSFESNGATVDGLPSQIIAKTGNPFGSASAAFNLELHLNGTGGLKLLPLGDTTTVSMDSSWPSPSFSGSYLPKSRTVTETGFSATWQISSLGRSLPGIWREGTIDVNLARQSAFGVQLFKPVGLYQLSLRATKYAVLFIGLTFVAYFLFEVISGLRLHPLQYLLVGFANTLFYLLLLSLAEHVPFGLAYLLGAIASTALISAYSLAVLELRARALLMAIVLTLLYGFLYMTLKAETYAMLAGSIGLWVALAVVMYLTRRVDWYSRNGSEPDESTGLKE
jgi:inner membrane protein